MNKVLCNLLTLGIVVTAFLTGCGGEGGSSGAVNDPPAIDGDGLTSGTTDTDSLSSNESGTGSSTTTPPKIAGFDFEIKAGDFWEFRWRKDSQNTDSGSSTNTGSFVVWLGAPKIIQGVTAYPVKFSGTGSYVKERWKYIALAKNTLYASADGIALKELFNAQTGIAPGNGFFEDLGGGLFKEQVGAISNEFITDSQVYFLAQSTDDSQCHYYPETGTICGTSGSKTAQKEYYKRGIGPVGYYNSVSYTSGSGLYTYGSKVTENIGLIKSSLRGDSIAPPVAPSGLAALPVLVRSSSRIDLSWKASTAGFGIAEYKVYRDGVYLKSAETTSVSDLGLNLTTRYCYAVSSVDNAGTESAQCVQVCATTPDPPDTAAPSMPAALTATAVSSTQIDLSWSASTDNIAVTGYKIYRNGIYLKTVVRATTTSDTSLRFNAQYCYAVSAVDGAYNESVKSGEQCATTLQISR